MISRLRLPIVAGLGSLVSLCLLFFISPSANGIFPPCPIRMYLGIDCPGCGGIRGTYSLLHGDITGALSHNMLLLVIYPSLLALWFLWTLGSWKQRDFFVALRPHYRVIMGAALFAVVGFTIVRNLIPGLGWGSGA